MRVFYKRLICGYSTLAIWLCFSAGVALGADQLNSTDESGGASSGVPAKLASDAKPEATPETMGTPKATGEPVADPAEADSGTDEGEGDVVTSYIISAGDLLSITVFGEPDLSIVEVRVGRNGSISFPLLGEILIKGFSSSRLEKRLITLLRDGYLKKPRVTVSILEYRMFYVNGEVHKPGGYKYVDGLTVQKAVALAGGFNERASKSKITLVREHDPEKPLKSVRLNLEVHPGDILTIGESFF